MSSMSFPRAATPARSRRSARPGALQRIGTDSILAVVVLAITAAVLADLPSSINADTWLGLVTGREVWQGGLPHQETLTAIAHGVTWVDQQWLSQLAIYAIYRVGGIGLVGLGGSIALVAGIGGAAAAARRLGAPMVSVLVTLPLCVWLIWPSLEVRTQDFAIPLFVAVAYLVARDARSPSGRIYWCLPLLVLWANLHGSVTLGAMLVALRGATVAWERRASMLHCARAWRRPLALIAGAAVSILITPYGLAIVAYYHATIFAGALRHTVIEWQPITTAPLQAAVLTALAALAAWALWRNLSSTTLWERFAVLALLAASVSVQRNALFFSLLALMLVPVWLGLGKRAVVAPPDRRRLIANGALIAVSVLAALAAAASALARPAAALELHFQRTGVLTAVRRATLAHPGLRVLADVRFDDWLLWRDPALRGKLAFDASFESLTGGQLDGLQNFSSAFGHRWQQFARGYRLLVLDRTVEPHTVQAFLAQAGRRVLYDDGERVVILRAAGRPGVSGS